MSCMDSKNGTLHSKYQKNILNVEKFNEVRVIPQYGGKQFSVEFIYESSSVKEYEQSQGDGFMSIDMGVDNLMACAAFSNGRGRQFLIDGRYIKSVNAYYNKTVANLKSEYSKNKGLSSQNTKRMLRLYNGRANRINDYFNKAVSLLVEKCLEWGVTTVVVGYNKEQKQEINVGVVNNQNFVIMGLNPNLHSVENVSSVACTVPRTVVNSMLTSTEA